MRENNKIIKMDFQRTQKVFLRAVLITAIAIPLSLVVGLFSEEGASSIGTLPVFLGIMFYGVASFQLYHKCIFTDSSYFLEIGRISAERLVLSKALVAWGWLALIFVMGALGIGKGAWQVLGQGGLGVVSLISLFFQGMLLVTVIYMAATTCHVRMFSTYKTLAGIFVLVVVYALESDMILRLKRLGADLLGGIQQIMSVGALQGLLQVLAIEVVVTTAVMLVNLLLCCWLLRHKMHPSMESVK